MRSRWCCTRKFVPHGPCGRGKCATGWRISSLRHCQRVLWGAAESRTIPPQSHGSSLLARLRRLPAGCRRSLSRSRHHSLGVGQSEFAYPQSGSGAVRRKKGRLAVGSIYAALHASPRQLVEPSRNRNQSVLATVLGQTPDRRSNFSTETNSGLEPSYESPSNSHSMGVHPKEG